jgi:hypothetical protein
LINNRQNGRRRGRGGGPRSPNQAPGQGNRQDNRSRGNAVQLLEKYKSLARDAQLSGDRVLAETYLQYAEHYYRVLNESRARFEEQRRQRGDYMSDDDEDQDDSMGADGDDGDDRDDERYERDMPPQRQEREIRQDRDVRADRQDRPDRQDRGNRAERGERPERSERPVQAQPQGDRPRRDFREERNGEPRAERPRPRRFEEQNDERNGEERISLEVLPPAISAGDGEPATKAPRRRTRRPRDGEAEIAPAA